MANDPALNIGRGAFIFFHKRTGKDDVGMLSRFR